MVVGAGHPEDLVPVLVSDHRAVVRCHVPQRTFGLLGQQQVRRIPDIDGHVACPLAAIGAAGLDDARLDVAAERLHGKGEDPIEVPVVRFEPLGPGSRSGEEQEKR